MNTSNAQSQGLPPPHPLQHPRQAGLIQQHRPNSPHQSHTLQSTSQGPYVSPHTSTHSLSQHHPPYVPALPSHPAQHPGEATFFTAHPSPYSTSSAAGSYASSEPSDAMATQSAMSRQPYPPISSYQTPQSNSPASIHSPQHDPQGRPIYGFPPMSQSVYYPQPYQMSQAQAYGQPPTSSHQSSMTSAPGMLMSHQQPQQQMQHPQHSSHPPSSAMDSKPSAASIPRPPSVMAAPQGTPQTPQGPGMPSLPSGSSSGSGPNSSAAPGPIPATTPLVVRQDNNGVQWIAFEYSRDRVKMEYTIRCDVESVDIEGLPQDFKSANCVYPRACGGKDQYKGNRLAYESECNSVGWALAQLNPNLREKRGLIQRAVDSWRNSNQDVRLRSRRVRRMAKIHNRKQALPGAAGQLPGSAPGSAGLPPHGMPSNGPRPPPMGPGSGMPQHHHGSVSDAGDDVSVENDYPPPSQPSQQQHHPQHPSSQVDLSSPTNARYAQHFYPAYAQQSATAGASMPPSVPDAMDSMPSHASALANPITASTKKDEDEQTKRNLFGDVPESKRRKFILVDDSQRGTRVRVRVMLDQVNMDEMPDAHLRTNAVYPRSFYPRQMRSPPGSPRARGQWDDEDDTQEDGSPTRGKTFVPVQMADGTESKLPVPRMTKSRRDKEMALNELGYRMAWGQARTFNGRTLFLQRSLDAYRNKMRSTMIAGGQDAASIAPHFETRPGKRRWTDRTKRARRAPDSP